MINIGLTGGIGSGKSTVARWFQKKGIPVLDADKTVHRLLKSDHKTISELVKEFGEDIQEDNGQISRLTLGRRVFVDEDARKRLERIVHPRLAECMLQERDELHSSGCAACVWDVPLLYEAGFDKFVDEVWVVWIPLEMQISRVLERDKLDLSEVKARIQAQASLEEKRQKADVVIDNSGDENQTINQLEQIWENYFLKK